MERHSFAILITSYNRINKTVACLEHLYNAILPADFCFDIFLVDDLSPDKTGDIITRKFPLVNVIYGSGNLYWGGGMRLAWTSALKNEYEYYLLLNDDVILHKNAFEILFESQNLAYKKHNKYGITVGSTICKETNKVSYGGNVIIKNHFIVNYKLLTPNKAIQTCHLTNANILLIHNEVINSLGFFDEHFIHGFADFDYSYNAFKKGFPVYIATDFCGYCCNDNGNKWQYKKSFSERINYLYSPKGLAYKEYIYYIRKNFPLSLPCSIILLWAKTLFPGIWERFKK